MQRSQAVLGIWEDTGPEKGDRAMQAALTQLNHPIYVAGACDEGQQPSEEYPLKAYVPALLPQDLGDASFKKAYHLRYAYVAGAMAEGISSVEMVEEMARAGMLGFFGASGLPLAVVEKAIARLQASLGDLPFGSNLMHNANDPEWENAIVDLYLRHGIHLADAAAFVDLTPALVLYRIKGIHREPDGRIVCPNQVLAKISRVEVARRFLAPPPEKALQALLADGRITQEEAELARFVPMAQDLLAEADSGGHTDNRPALVLLPTLQAVCDELNAVYQYPEPVRVGLGGGIGTPAAAAAAFSMGAACVLIGSVNQSCVEAGTSQTAREMLAAARPVDVVMAPSADMFERGGQAQVLKRGTIFAQRARELYEMYCRYDSLESIPQAKRQALEQDIFGRTLEEEWASTRDFFNTRDCRQIQRAETDPKHKMALVFRSYLGQASRWAISGNPSRKMDYLIWCGPAMGAFNEWAKGSFLEKAENRRVVTVALNLLSGAAVLIRAGWLRMQGIALPREVGGYRPMTLEAIRQLCEPEPISV